MGQDEFFKIIGIILVCFFIIYMAIKMLYVQTKVIEGLTNNNETLSTPSSGEAGSSSSYGAAIKAKTIKLQDELLIAKYRNDYESTIIHLDDYISYLMLKTALNMNLEGDIKSNIESINQLNTLHNSKEALNSTMSFLDKN